MKFIRDNFSLLSAATLVLILIGAMVFIVSNSAGSPAEASVPVPRVSATPILRIETLAPSVTPLPVPSLTLSVTPTTAPTSTPTCTDEDREAIRQALVEAWNVSPGVSFETNGSHPPCINISGVVSGQVRTEERDGYNLDLTRMFYLDNQSNLRSMWLAFGVQYPDGSYVSPAPPGWGVQFTAHEEGMAFYGPSGRGRSVALGICDWYVRPDSIHWENCPNKAQFTSGDFCKIGLELELESQGGSAALCKTEIAPENWIAFNWSVGENKTPPDFVTPLIFELPESALVCP